VTGLDDAMTEAELQEAVVEAATRFGWLCYHDYDSRRNQPGFPDLVLVRPPNVMFIECKTARGRVRPGQQVWLDALKDCDTVMSGVVRPGDLDRIIATLQGGVR